MNRLRRIDVYFLVILVIVSNLSSGITKRELSIGDNEYCAERPTLVSVDSPLYNHFPKYVSLYRCGGSVSDPRKMVCSPDTMHDVRIKVLDVITTDYKTIVEKNHTSCSAKCRYDESSCNKTLEYWDAYSCGCRCKYGDVPGVECPLRFRWNADICRCECDVDKYALQCFGRYQIWNDTKCACKCSSVLIESCQRRNKDVDEDKCRCVDRQPVTGQQSGEGCISTHLLYGVVVGEFLLLLIIFNILLDLKGFGLIYLLRRVATRSEKDENNPPSSPVANNDQIFRRQSSKLD